MKDWNVEKSRLVWGSQSNVAEAPGEVRDSTILPQVSGPAASMVSTRPIFAPGFRHSSVLWFYKI